MADDWATTRREFERRLSMSFGQGGLHRFLLSGENWNILPSYINADWVEQLQARTALQAQFVEVFGPTGFVPPSVTSYPRAALIIDPLNRENQ